MSVSLGEPPPAVGTAQEGAAGSASEVSDGPRRRTRPERFRGPRSRRATYAVLTGIGIELGLIGAFLSFQVLHLNGVPVPIGPVVAVVANLAAGLFAIRITRNRTAVMAPALGWLGIVLLLSSSRAEGDLVITNTGRGVAFLFLGALAWLAAAAAARFGIPHAVAGPPPEHG